MFLLLSSNRRQNGNCELGSISPTFYVHIFCTDVVLHGSFFYVNVSREKLPKQHLYKKNLSKMLMKLTPIVNFINVFLRAFFVRMSFRQLFLVTFRLCQKFRTKNARVKC
jgi:hypothetical protein